MKLECSMYQYLHLNFIIVDKSHFGKVLWVIDGFEFHPIETTKENR